MIRHLLIDADVLAYKAASAVEVAVEWEPGHWTWHADFEAAKRAFCDELLYIRDKLDGDTYTLALTDAANFRKAILPTYKANRAGNKKPLVLKPMREWLLDEMGAKMKPGLEGDDVLGILATMKHDDERIIVSIDKDFKTVPGLHTRDLETIVEMSEVEANRWHMIQTLTGDPTDGYIGCRGVGIKKATAICSDSYTLANGERAPREDQMRWERVVATFEKYGFTEADALVQARVARILRASDYDFKRKEPILWNPK